MSTTAQRPRIAFSALTHEGKLHALNLWQPDYFTGADDPAYSNLPLEKWQALVMAHWESLPIADASFCDDNSGRM